MPSDDKNRPEYRFEQAHLSVYGINDRCIPGFRIENGEGEMDGKLCVRLRGFIHGEGSCDMAYAPLPFVYDEILLGGRAPDQIGWRGVGRINEFLGFLVVRRGKKWSALLLAERKADMKMFAEHVGPFVFDSPEAVADWIEANKDSFALGSVADMPSPPYYAQRDWLLEAHAQMPDSYTLNEVNRLTVNRKSVFPRDFRPGSDTIPPSRHDTKDHS